MAAQAQLFDTYLELAVAGSATKFHFVFLRDHCECVQCFHPVTKQRLLDTFAAVSLNVKPKSADVDAHGTLRVDWDGHVSTYDAGWLAKHSYWPPLSSGAADASASPKSSKLDLVHWDKAYIEAHMPRVDYNGIRDSPKAAESLDISAELKKWINNTYYYGFCFVDNVPVDPVATQELIEKITFIMPTHYGAFWDFTSNLLVNDTAYTDIAIPLHTDGTYWSQAPGYQSFHLLKHEGTGGETSLVDGIRCAQLLQKQSPEYFRILSETPVDFHCAGEETVFIKPVVPGPIIVVDKVSGEVVQIRWNNSDRECVNKVHMANNGGDMHKFYEALYAFNAILNSEENVIFHQLRPGELLLFDNWRVLHSRTSFTGERRMCGAYYTKDDFISTFKTQNGLAQL